MSPARWDFGSSVEKCHVFSQHKRERQRDVGAAPPESQLRYQHFLVHHYWNDYELLRQTNTHRERQTDSSCSSIIA